MSETIKRHKEEAPKGLKFALIVCSTSRFRTLKAEGLLNDPSGDFIARALESNGHKVSFRTLIPDDKSMIEEAVKMSLKGDVDVIIVCGGTGISPSDVTIEAVRPLLEKELLGFGELLRWLSYQEVGSAAVLTRAIAGVANEKAVFCIPGSINAVKLSVEKIILPEAGHIVKHARERIC